MSIKQLLEQRLNEEDSVPMVHITTNDIANKIEQEGFDPKGFIDYKYYSNLGKDGIYFYKDEKPYGYRIIQQYAYFLVDKVNQQTVALIFVDVPKNIIVKGDSHEDGFFVPKDQLDKIKIKKIQYNVKPRDLY